MNPGFSPKSRIIGLSLVLLGIAAWLTPALDQFANCRKWQAKLDANVPYSQAVGQNHHVAVSNFRQDSAAQVGMMPYGPWKDGYLTYVPIISARAVGKPLYEDFRLVLKTVTSDPQVEVESLMQSELLTGIVRRPKMFWIGKLFHEDEVIKNWCAPAPAEWYILDLVPRRYIQWQDVGFLVPLILAVYCAYRIACLIILTRPENQVLSLTVGAVVMLAAGVILLLLQPGGPAAWNTICPWLASVMVLLSAGALPAFTSQLIVNHLKKLELERQKAARGGQEEDDPHAAPFEPTPNGFILRDATGKHEYLDVAVQGITIARTPAVNERKEQVIVRTVRLRVVEGKNTDTFTIRNLLTRGETDALQPFFSRLISSMGRRYAAEMKSSGELSGEGWTLSGCGLTLTRGERKETIGPKLLNSAEWVGDKFCIWTADNEEPVLVLDSSSENVYVLAEAITAVLPSKLLPTKFATGLGRLRCSLSCDQRHRSSALAKLIRRTGTSRFRCFDDGVQISVTGPLETIKYRDLESSSWNLHPELSRHAGIHAFTLTPVSGKPVTFEFSLPEGIEVPAAILDLKKRVVEATAAKVLEQLARTGSAPWTSLVTLQFEGFSVQGGEVIPYTLVEAMKLDSVHQKLCLRWSGGACEILVEEANFDAGWQVFQLIRQTISGETGQESAYATSQTV